MFKKIFTKHRQNDKKKFFDLQISNLIQETSDSVRISIKIPPPLENQFRFLAGQYLNIKHKNNKKIIERSYSICSSPSINTELSILVKQIPNGIFSTFANRVLKKGQQISVSNPEGNFTLDLNKFKSPQQFVAIANGSGITPILSMMYAIDNSEIDHKISLLYGSKSKKQSIFFDTINNLIQRHPKRFKVVHTFSRESTENYPYGRIDEDRIIRFFKDVESEHIPSQIFLCGSYDLVQVTRKTLLKIEYQEEQIETELFFVPEQDAGYLNDSQSYITKLQIDGETIEFKGNGTDYILDTCIAQDIDIPYGCANGVCSKCKCKVIEGKVKMDDTFCLSGKEIKDGYILTCRSKLKSNVVIHYE